MNIKQKLEYHYKRFDKTKISPDPLEFPHRYQNYFDVEISALISSVFAYGNINMIMKILEELHNIMGESPYNYVINFSKKKQVKKLSNLKYRFYSTEDVLSLFLALQKIYETYGSLKYFFLLYTFLDEKNLKNSISFFSKNIRDIFKSFLLNTRGTDFMFPDSLQGSSCKRINLFLRWMVRKDELDFGLWQEIDKSKLVIPVDTHIAKICKSLKLTEKKNISWKMAEEITENLKNYDSTDPTKYDFALCHIGMRKLNF